MAAAAAQPLLVLGCRFLDNPDQLPQSNNMPFVTQFLEIPNRISNIRRNITGRAPNYLQALQPIYQMGFGKRSIFCAAIDEKSGNFLPKSMNFFVKEVANNRKITQSRAITLDFSSSIYSRVDSNWALLNTPSCSIPSKTDAISSNWLIRKSMVEALSSKIPCSSRSI
mgnify:CR=1 FL=1